MVQTDADTVYDYGSNSVEQFDRVYNRAGARTYPVVDIEPPYVNAPHYKGQQNQELRERNYATFIRGGAGINFGHEKWWPFGVTGLFDGGPDWLTIIMNRRNYVPNTHGHFSIPMSKTVPGRLTTAHS